MILDRCRRNDNNHYNLSDDLTIIANAVTNEAGKAGRFKAAEGTISRFLIVRERRSRGNSRFFPHKEMQ
jgi:hypothetical protein